MDDRERLDPTQMGQGSLVPKWATVEHDDPNARHCILSYWSHGVSYVDLFLFDKTLPIEENVKRIAGVVGGRFFEDVRFICWVGEQVKPTVTDQVKEILKKSPFGGDHG